MPEDLVVLPQPFTSPRYTADQITAVATWIRDELLSAQAARQPQEALWAAHDRLYRPVREKRNRPVEGGYTAPVPIGAIACDALYAQGFDLIFSLDPPITVRQTRVAHAEQSDDRTDDIKALQDWIDWKTAHELRFRDAVSNTWLSTCKKGTGVYYIPFVNRRRKTRAGGVTTDPRSVIYSMPIDDVFVPGGRDVDLQDAPWVGLRFWKSRAEMAALIKANNWTVSIDQLIERRDSLTRTQAESTAKTTSTKAVVDEEKAYQLFDFYALFDIDGDGIPEDLLIHYDHGSGTVLALDDNPHDRRPVERCRYQLQEHFFAGLGVMDMLEGFQQEATDVFTEQITNMKLANVRIFAGPAGAHPGGSVSLFSGKYVAETQPNSFREIKISDIYPSADRVLAALMSLAERRVGANELSVPKPSALLGSRTPTGTATIGMAQVNRRFSPAFDELRAATGNAVKQALFRDQEQLLAGNADLRDKITRILGPENGERVIRLLRDPEFDNAVLVELKASTANMNREAERQNNLVILNVLATYYDRIISLSQIAATPDAPPELVKVIQKVMSAATELVERVLRTFDQIRDPAALLVEVNDQLGSLEATAGAAGLGDIAALLSSGAELDAVQQNVLPNGNGQP